MTDKYEKDGYRYTTAVRPGGGKITVIESSDKLIEIERTSPGGSIIYVAVDGANSLVYSNNRSVTATGFIEKIAPLIEGALSQGEWAALDQYVVELGKTIPKEKAAPGPEDVIARALAHKKGETQKAYDARVAATIQKSEKMFPQIQEIARVLRADPHLEPGVADTVEDYLGFGLADGKISRSAELGAIRDALAQAGGTLEIRAEGVEIEVAGRCFTLTPPPPAPKGEVVRKR